MEIHKRSSWLLLFLGISLLATALQGVQGEAEQGPSESECRPYIEKALKELEAGDDTGTTEQASGENQAGESKEDAPTVEITTDDSAQKEDSGEDDTHEAGIDEPEAEADERPNSDEKNDTTEDDKVDSKELTETTEEVGDDDKVDDSKSEATESEEVKQEESTEDEANTAEENEVESKEDERQSETEGSSVEDVQEGDTETDKKHDSEEQNQDEEDQKQSEEDLTHSEEGQKQSEEEQKQSAEDEHQQEDDVQQASVEDDKQSIEDEKEHSAEDTPHNKEDEHSEEVAGDSEQKDKDSKETSTEETASIETEEKPTEEAGGENDNNQVDIESADTEDKSEQDNTKESKEDIPDVQADEPAKDSKEEEKNAGVEEITSKESDKKDDDGSKEVSAEEETKDDTEEGGESTEAPEEELIMEIEVPDEIRPRDHIEQLLKLDDESQETEKIVDRISEITLRELKRLYENAIKPLEVLYKYRDLSNRHFGDSEIFSKPLILFMGPWSGGKSSIINYLVDNEYNETSLRTGAEPSPAYFNILTYGEEYEVVDGTQLTADFTFSGLQKFGQGLEERLRGVKLPRKLLDKVNIVEIPGILEVRKQVSRVFPFNDACQWFIDRADIIFLVYDPSKLDVGPETEAILDQLKGREHQTRIILNKADQVKPEELMRVQGALIWNISPLMSSAQPPVMYTTSLWSRPYEPWAPVRLLQAQERAFLKDLRTAVDKRIENKISSARRFAVRVRNHAKMVDCYLTTYYNHKSVFGNKKQVADEIIEHPQDYHIYEGLSTLTNISRYDLPDPEVYRDFFKLNPLYEFQQLSSTCTYFRGCPINRLDVAIAYDLPELVGKHRRLVESSLAEASAQTAPGS